MQTQQDLIDLIGLKISDEKLIKHFDALSLKQPKNCTPNNSSADINDKANNIGYWFNYDVKHEACHPPKREGKPAKWTTYLTSISFVNESTILKKADSKPNSFWNISPPPTADLATVTAFFGEATTNKFNDDVLSFSKKINDLVEINCQFSIKNKRARAIWASIIDERELISYLYFRDLAVGESDDYGSGSAQQNFICMLVKWLHDNKHLNVAQSEALAADKAAILKFVHAHFRGKIWQNHLVNQDRMFANFISDGMSLFDEKSEKINFRFQDIGLKALGKWDEYRQFEIKYDKLAETNNRPDTPYWDEQEAFMKSIPINENNYALFAKAIDDNLALYSRLMQLPVNREKYNFD